MLLMPDSPQKKYGIDVVPPAYVTSPHIDGKPGDDVPWWTPSWSEILAHLGWRWLYFLPAALLVFGLALLPLRPGLIQVVLMLWKPMLIAAILPTAMAVRAMQRIVRDRKDPFCIHCGYTLLGLPDGHRCPECGRTFTLAVIEEYRRDPKWFVQRWHTMHTTLPRANVPFDAGTVRRRKSSDGT